MTSVKGSVENSSGQLILAVEDDTRMLENLRDILGSAGFRVISAGNVRFLDSDSRVRLTMTEIDPHYRNN